MCTLACMHVYGKLTGKLIMYIVLPDYLGYLTPDAGVTMQKGCNQGCTVYNFTNQEIVSLIVFKDSYC